MRRLTAAIVGAALLGSGLVGCGQPHRDDVVGVASTFYAAYTAQDGATACRHLAPKTSSELEKSAGKPCEEAVLEENLPEVGAPTEVHVFSTQAEVKWNGETTFLARFPGGWKVMAAACKPQPGQPYDCSVSGG
jgi:hypothetical protein